ncbi:hypothetical protein [Sandarakinorhabdus sp. DWP1-3-1]|uniref:hypothetical protein n=1 Tax=Sandarakinorhabdus sp. DWP1-3-1 TaxID=2804627 RepID=UPI003CF93F79
MKRLALIALLLLLAACGKQGELTPVPPRPAPLQAAETVRPKTPADMLKLPTQSAPQRVDDPVRNADQRPDDRFNLPPPQ